MPFDGLFAAEGAMEIKILKDFICYDGHDTITLEPPRERM